MTKLDLLKPVCHKFKNSVLLGFENVLKINNHR